MADSAQIDFTSVGVSAFGFGPFTITGSLEVDYGTPSSVTGTLTGSVFGETGSGSSFTLSGTGTGPFTITSAPYTVTLPIVGTVTGQFAFTYSTETPTSITSAELIVTTDSTTVPLTVSPNVLTSALVCFAEGTLIRTPLGDVPVETLNVGDLVVTASGERRPIKWIGHRDIEFRLKSKASPGLPVRIAADAFGANRPSQDLFLSPGHSVCVDLLGEALIPVGRLVNGATIAQVEVDTIRYWHVELESHDILIANNLPAESYLAMANRGFFEDSGATLDAFDEGSDKTHADFCRPVVLEGPVLDFARKRLVALAEAAGWTRSFETDLQLLVDGEARRPVCEGDAAVFLFPAGARDVRLISNTFIPSLLGRGDPRSLGLSLAGLVFSNGRGEARAVSLDDERLKDGLHPEEARDGVAWRWTKGELVLSPDFWTGLAGPIALAVTHRSPPVRQWIRPPMTQPEAQSRETKPQLYAVA